MKKFTKYLGFVLILLFLSTYSSKNSNNKDSYFFPIKIINIENNKIEDKEKIKNELNYLLGKNLLLLNQSTIKSSFKKFDFVSDYQIKKVYPQTLKIIIQEKKPVAIYLSGKDKFYISNKGELIKFKYLEHLKELPLVFGKNLNFMELYNILKVINFPIYKIKSFHYFNIGRWDIDLKNKKTIKLPTKNYKNILKEFKILMNNKNFDKYQIFDYRIKDQVILN